MIVNHGEDRSVFRIKGFERRGGGAGTRFVAPSGEILFHPHHRALISFPPEMLPTPLLLLMPACKNAISATGIRCEGAGKAVISSGTTYRRIANGGNEKIMG